MLVADATANVAAVVAVLLLINSNSHLLLWCRPPNKDVHMGHGRPRAV